MATKPKSLQRLITMSTASLCIASSAIATEQAAPFEGTIDATLTGAATEATHFAFNRKGDRLRIANTTNKIEPLNILDLAANKVTIVYPHNTTFVVVNLAKKAAQASSTQMPASLPTPANVNASQSEATRGRIGPNISPPPGFSSPPQMPSTPQLPRNAIGGPPALPNPGTMPMPPSPGFGAPGMPPMLGMFGATELKKTDKMKTIQGFNCTLYTATERGQIFEVWATNDAALFPFRLIEREYLGRHFGPQMLEETWPELLRNKSLFPLEATLKMEQGGQERLTFKIEKVEKKKIDLTEAEKLFSPPEKYIEIEVPQI